MNKLFIIGNLVRNPELRSTQSGIPVCTFTVAVNRKKTAEAGQPEADYFRCTAWRQLAENCNRFLSKGKKVGVVGSLTLGGYTAKDGTTKSSMEVSADEVEFLSPREPVDDAVIQPTADEKKGFVKVDESDSDLPF